MKKKDIRLSRDRYTHKKDHLLARVNPMVPVPQNKSRTISESSPLSPAESSISL
jgi:hypothetical protein